MSETYVELNTDVYTKEAELLGKEIHVVFFDKRFFSGTTTYNELLMSENFYQSFSDYEYILIYHLDAWVFSDDLLYWCRKGYDYIGAPWFQWSEDNKDWSKVFSGEIGNGGFSLRKVSYFLETFNGKKNLYKLSALLKQVSYNPKSWVIFIAKLFGFHNNVRWYIDLCSIAGVNEDVFWCQSLKGTSCEMKMPDVKESLSFAFEMHPDVCFSNNGQKLPFGCHGWGRHKNFWMNYIKV